MTGSSSVETIPSGLVQIAPAYSPPSSATYLGPTPNGTTLSVEVALGPSSIAPLESIATEVNTPGAPRYHHFLSASEVRREFGATNATLSRASSYFAGFGLSVAPSPDHFLLSVTGGADQIGSAFHTRFSEFRLGGRTIFSHTTPAYLPSRLPWYGAVGLGNVSVVHPFAQGVAAPAVTPSTGGCAVSGPLPPCAFWNGYDYAGLLKRGVNGTGFRIGIIDGYAASEPQTRLAEDFANFTLDFGLPAGNVQFAYPVAAGNSLNTSNSGDVWATEEALDLEWARATAPGDAITMALTANNNAAIYGAVDWFVAQDAVQALSMSWGEPDVGVYNAFSTPCPSACNASSDGSYGLLHPVLAAAAAEGISVFAASGDCGAADGTSGVATNYPASDPWTTGVGGTSLNVNGTGQWVAESGWSGNSSGASSPGCGNLGGSGGGWSPFPRPPWQAGTGLPSSPQRRGVPDVALDAAAYVPIILGGGTFYVIGTSVGTPSWAGITAVMDQSTRGREGFLNPGLYSILQNGSYSGAFHDITSGSNGYAAGTGWDPVTGLGTPDVARLLPALSRTPFSVTDLFAQIRANLTGGPAPLSVSFTANVTGGTTPYRLYDFTFGDGNASAVPVPTASHTFPMAGVYNATVTVFDATSNSTVSAPVVIVVGGGHRLAVTLTASSAGGPTGTSVSFRVTASGGTAPYTYQVWFGDGTFSLAGSSSSATHVYRSPGGFCALAMVSDSASPVNGGGSPPVSIAIGTPFRPVCALGPRLYANISSATIAADLPGDLPLRWNATGGLGPLTTWISSADPYSTLCQCGVFRTVGALTVILRANDSLGNFTTRTLNVTIYPRLTAIFASTPTTGVAGTTFQFSATVNGGHGADVNRTTWSVNAGPQSVGRSASYTFNATGQYSVLADLTDQGGGNASGLTFLNVTGPAPSALRVQATVSPGELADLGAPVEFTAIAAGGSGTYRYLWNLSDGSSAYGSSFYESPNPPGCAALGPRCWLNLTLTVRDSGGNQTVLRPQLGPFFGGIWSALNVSTTFGPRGGATPLRWTSSTTGAGLPGVSTLWNYGDGGASAGDPGHHAYLRPGNFTVVGTVTDAGADRWSLDQAVHVTGAVIPPPAAQIEPALSVCFAPCHISFTANTSGGVPPFVDNWTFGDGTNATGANVTHQFPNNGTYRVTLNATDSLGDVTNASRNISVYPPTPVDLEIFTPASSIPAGSTFPLVLSAYPFCGPDSVPGCATRPISVELESRLNNSSGVALAIRPVAPFLPNATLHVGFVAPALQGVFWLAMVALPPNFTGQTVAQLSVGPPSSSGPGPLAVELLALGLGAGVAAAAVVVIYERRRRPREPVAPAP